MTVKYNELKAGDMIFLCHDIDPCLFGGQPYKVYETENEEKYIKCTDGMHFLDGMVDENGEIPEFIKCNKL